MKTKRQSTSSRRGKKRDKKAPRMSNKLNSELRRLAELSELDIDKADMPEVLDWSRSVVGKYYRPIKNQDGVRKPT